LANAGQHAAGFVDTEFGVVVGKLDRFFHLRGRRIAAARAASKYNLIRREFGSLLDATVKLDRIPASYTKTLA